MDELGEPLVLHDVLASEAENPAMTAARNIDWRLFISTLDKPALAILTCMAQGKPLQKVASAFGLRRTTIQTRKERLEHFK
jgi:DNA-binding NarL/FixJ family response regulator